LDKDVWENCYEIGWRGLIVPEAFCHPAKFSRKLIERIYNHAMDNSWLKKGDFVLDPFGGVALGALDAMGMGLNWIGCELEEKFVKLGEENIKKWKSEIGKSKGTARMIHGDSRKLKFYIGKLLSEVDNLKDFDIVISSPPFENCHNIVGVEGHSRQVTSERVKSKIRYGYNKNQLGNVSGDAFWFVSKEIVQESYDLLKQDGRVIWVVKDYVSKGKLIPFSDRWVTLCESIGFKVACWHHAMVVKKIPQHTFDGSEITKNKKSFFRRLHEQKGSPKIDWENVVCMVK
jgi:SAM-dependent methyltransferase